MNGGKTSGVSTYSPIEDYGVASDSDILHPYIPAVTIPVVLPACDPRGKTSQFVFDVLDGNGANTTLDSIVQALPR